MKESLQKIDIEISEGRKLKACDRLRNLIKQFPNDLSLYEKLATVYYESGFYDAAGKYWIFIEPKNENVKRCVEIYKKSVNYSGTKILQDLKFSGNKSELNEYAKNQLDILEKDSLERSKYVPNFQKEKRIYPKGANETLKDKIIQKVFLGFVILIILLVFLGVAKVWEWIIY